MIDLRSDTVTRPTEAMLKAMFTARVGDDVYGEDPEANAFEALIAAHLKHEAGLFVPSGTMANQLAIHMHTRPGDSVLCEEDSHVYLYESGAGAALSGVQFDLIPFAEDFSDSAMVRFVKPAALPNATTTLCVVENTHNRAGGEVRSVAECQRIVATAKKLGLRTHLDGARIWNAAIASRCHEADFTRLFDSVSVCFSKGLGAPVGSMICGPKAFIDRARKIRKRWGGGMRQIGYLAKGARYAFENHRERLTQDHDHARKLFDVLESTITRKNLHTHGSEGTYLRVLKQPSNMVYLHVPESRVEDVVARAKSSGILFSHAGQGWIRMVTHLDLPAGFLSKVQDFFGREM